jgi:hypothetical protein
MRSEFNRRWPIRGVGIRLSSTNHERRSNSTQASFLSAISIREPANRAMGVIYHSPQPVRMVAAAADGWLRVCADRFVLR